MDSFELNKILGAVLGTCLALLSLNIAAGAMFSTHAPAKPGYEVAVRKTSPAGEPGEAAPAEEPLPVRFASADVGRGENVRKEMRPPATPSARASRTASAPIYGAWSAARRRRRRASTIRRR